MRSGIGMWWRNYFNDNNMEIKKHTIRANYDLWEKRFQKIDKGEAQLSIRVWSGLPYRSKQVIIENLTKKDGIALTRARKCIITNNILIQTLSVEVKVKADIVAKNDGLNHEDFEHWFDHIEPLKDLAFIYFGRWRY